MNYRVIATKAHEEEDGWYVDSRETLGTLQVDNKKDIPKQLVRQGFVRRKGIVIRKDFDDSFMADDRNTYEPLLEIKPVDSGPSVSDIAIVAGGVLLVGVIGYAIYSASQLKTVA